MNSGHKQLLRYYPHLKRTKVLEQDTGYDMSQADKQLIRHKQTFPAYA